MQKWDSLKKSMQEILKKTGLAGFNRIFRGTPLWQKINIYIILTHSRFCAFKIHANA